MSDSRNMLEEHVSDLLPGYALGSLDEEDLLQVARHLPHCVSCRNELSSYWITVDHLAFAVPLRNPPPGLKGKILQRVEVYSDPAASAFRQPVADNRSEAEAPPTPVGWSLSGFLRSLTVHPLGLALGSAVVLVIVLLLLSNVLLWNQVNELQAQLPGKHVRIVQLTGTENAPQAQGYLMIFPEENYGTLVIEDAPELDPGYQYQLWLIRDGKRTSGGVLSVNEQGYGTLQISADQALNNFPSFGVTVEPAGGSPGPTGEKVLGGDL